MFFTSLFSPAPPRTLSRSEPTARPSIRNKTNKNSGNGGEELERRIDKSEFLYKNPQALEYLNELTKALTVSEVPVPRVKILRQAQLNAFALPHGTIYINTGLLARMDNEAQLATVFGHELTHFTHRHALKETRNAKNKTVFHESVSSLFVLVGVPPGERRRDAGSADRVPTCGSTRLFIRRAPS